MSWNSNKLKTWYNLLIFFPVKYVSHVNEWYLNDISSVFPTLFKKSSKVSQKVSNKSENTASMEKK